MKKIYLLLLFILIPLVIANTETTEMLNFNSSATVSGKTLTITDAETSGKLKVTVDGVKGIVKPGINRTSEVNGMFVEILNFTYFDFNYIETILEITVNFECGDDFCNISETSAGCCTDCGCDGNIKCINNICQKEECVIDAECDDFNICTSDKCSSEPPRTCSNTLITECVGNDSCCPDICAYENDTDCEKVEISQENITLQSEEVSEEIEQEIPEPEIIPEEQVIIKEKGLTQKEKKGLAVMIVVASLVSIIGFFVYLRRPSQL